MRRIGFEMLLQLFKPGLGIAELIELYVETIHEREVQTAHLPFLLARVQVIQSAPGFERASKTTG